MLLVAGAEAYLLSQVVMSLPAPGALFFCSKFNQPETLV